LPPQQRATRSQSASITKRLHRSFLSLLSIKCGTVLSCLGAVWCATAALSIIGLILTSYNTISDDESIMDSRSTAALRRLSSLPGGSFASLNTNVFSQQRDFTDNVAGIDMSHRMSVPPVDIVYTWVNGSDPVLQAQLAKYKQSDESEAILQSKHEDPEIADHLAPIPINSTSKSNMKQEENTWSGSNRFRDNEELQYSLRSVFKYAPWIRRIFIVTSGQVPSWLNIANPRVTIVQHSDIFVNQSHLPTFSSPAIESHLHRIPGLSRHFLYLNDDVMFGNHIEMEDFWSHGKGHQIYLSWNIPNCANGCPDTWINDGYCDNACNVPECRFDGQDCINITHYDPNDSTSLYGSQQSSSDSTPTIASPYCAQGCPNNWLGDKVCDRTCKNAACGYDAGELNVGKWD
jgi:UDP-N-acetylglucosamine-lysosomal-enzyme